MLAPRQVIFTALEGALLDRGSDFWEPASDALSEIGRRGVPLVLVTSRTRAQIEPLRRKIGQAFPFITESGGGLFIPDGYFPMHLEKAFRVGRYFCVPFARAYDEAVVAVEKIASEVGIEAIGYAQMTAREVARNTGQSIKEADLDRQREFSERFFFAGESDGVARRFSETAAEHHWHATPGEPFWELSSGNDAGRAVNHLMGLYRAGTRDRLRSVGIGATASDLRMLLAVDQAIVLPGRRHEFDPLLESRLPNAVLGKAGGPIGWNTGILELLEAKEMRRR